MLGSWAALVIAACFVGNFALLFYYRAAVRHDIVDELQEAADTMASRFPLVIVIGPVVFVQLMLASEVFSKKTANELMNLVAVGPISLGTWDFVSLGLLLYFTFPLFRISLRNLILVGFQGPAYLLEENNA